MTDVIDKRLRELEKAHAAHEAGCAARWEEQGRASHRCQKDREQIRVHMEQNFGLVFRKLSHIEIKLAAFCAGASLAGGTIAHFLPWS